MSISVLGDFILLSFPSVEASLGMWRCIRKPRAPIVFHTRTGCLSQLVCWQGNPTARSVHSEARYGFDGENATVYERSRPGYPTDVIRAIENEVLRYVEDGPKDVGAFGESDHSHTLVELGCGTGKFTRDILPFARARRFSLVGVEPVKGMRDQFELVLPGVPVMEGTGESIPVPNLSAQVVFAAQSFHWMSTAATLREVHRILVPGGALILVWNTRDASKPWIRALEDIIDPFYRDDVPRQHGGLWRKAFDELEKQQAGASVGGQPQFFGHVESQHFPSSQYMTLDELEERIRSISVIATRPEQERLDAMRRARELAESHPGTRTDLEMHGKVELIYDTELHWCRKLPV